ncbi:MAG: EamA/RhaT family transporter [Deltaproteobacteria bacterium]|nr:EamA/RhaT family transporter [Deltaproteobacteria bacterium]
MASRMPSRGLLYMAASALGFSGMSVLVKVTSPRLPTGEIVLARAVVTLVLSYVMVKRADLSPWGNERGRLVLRGLLGFGGLTCYYVALAHLPLADATTIQNTTPLVTALLAWWLLREQVGWSTVVAIGFGIAGVMLVVHPSGAGLDPVGLAFGFGAATCSAVAYVTVRQLARTEHPLVIVFYFPLVATPLAIPWAVADWVTPQPIDWLLLIAIGLATQVGQVFLTMGLSVERAGRATSVGYLQVLFAMIWQSLVFADPPTLTTLAGAGLIVAGTLAVASVGTAGRASPSPRSPPPPA